MIASQQDKKFDKWLTIAIWLVIGTGILFRIALLLQNRNLFIDEANIARNVYERTFPGLAMPLSYEQYAPPIFMWILKVHTLIFGYSEYVFRLYSLVTGIGALVMFVAVMKAFKIKCGALYPLFLMATGFIFLRYSTEVKQYMPDTFIALLLVWLALKIDIYKSTILQFVVMWTAIGTLSIWSSMPSVFVLAGVGVYYACTCIRNKDTKKLMPVIISGMIWLMQFLFYYISILKPQADSDYLHNYHKDYFIVLLPVNFSQWHHNMKLIEELLSEAGGYTFLVTIFNGLMLVIGCYMLFRKQFEKAFLIIVPIIALLLAAGVDQFSLIPRVSLFIMPFFLLLIANGFDYTLHIPSKIAKAVLVAIACIGAYNHCQFPLLKNPLKIEEITDGMKLLKDNRLTADKVYVHQGAAPAFIYYTEIHPGREQWQTLKYAHILHWNTDCEAIAQTTKTEIGFLYANGAEGEMNHCKDGVLKLMTITASITEKGCSAYVYRARQ